MIHPKPYIISKLYRLLLFLVLATSLFNIQAQTTQEQHISSVMSRILSENRIVGELTVESLQNLPVGVRKYVNANRYIIAIDRAVFTEKGIYLSALAELTLHGNKNKIAFAAKNIHMTPAGIVNDQPAQLVLVTPQRIAVNEQVSMVLPADRHNRQQRTANRSDGRSGRLHGYSP